ncbi:hypothetical protein OWR29_40965 [Actinoplanes sp. Pm04-4]|uniref:Uncharacterized protein n=1 Tax=Paractinoplanes pyxinae TaxID=2997416 RepID=A0ABT4BD67_9ACTN|nr:hypothetical protein [Actinoplanes pyxinae]MCY1144406.1 hypothetical protein [Actinoplanes pyxinae]
MSSFSVKNAEGTYRGYAALYGLFEIYIVPITLAAAFVLRATRFRPMTSALVIATIAGAIIVAVTALVVGYGSTWE